MRKEQLLEKLEREIFAENLHAAFIEIDSNANILIERDGIERRVKLSSALSQMIEFQDGTLDCEKEAKQLDRLAAILESAAKKARAHAAFLRKP